jgi:hypothetical protein
MAMYIFDLTIFNEVIKSDNLLKNIEANVINSCIEVIIGMPDIRYLHTSIVPTPLTLFHHKVTRNRVLLLQ